VQKRFEAIVSDADSKLFSFPPLGGGKSGFSVFPAFLSQTSSLAGAGAPAASERRDSKR
jgi:hypothetical protein